MDPAPIAIVGMSCRFPGGANSPEQLWDLLEQGRNAWTDVPTDRFRWESFYHPDSDLPNMTNHRGGHFLDQDVAAFDAKFFGIAGHEAEAMDPQQRMLIELSYEALENAGIPQESVRGSSTGVYMAIFNNDYGRILTRDVASLPKTFLTGNALSMLANKVSYLLDLKGPSILVDTACSGSLVALHQACQALRAYEIETAITGAANLILDPDVMVAMSDHHFLNGDGRSYSFDARGEGYGRGEGIGIVVLKRLTDALRDGDAIRAVIRNTGLGQDGKTAGITLPSAEAQASLIESVYARASLDPHDTAYVEAHGTGTVAGDYAELGTISNLFGGNRSGVQKSVHVGSIKANIGHTESTSGVAGLIKAALVVEKGLIPPNPPIEKLKRKMLPENSAVVIPQKTRQWPSDVRRASINSFGFGGTNAHCILESADFVNVAGIRAEGAAQAHIHPTNLQNGVTNTTETHIPVQIQTQFLLPISANSQESLLRTVENIKQWAETGTRPRDSLRDLAYTLSSRRSRLAFRSNLVGQSIDSGISILDAKARPVARVLSDVKMTFVFTGQGAQWFAMGRELLGGSTVFTDSIVRSEHILHSLGAPWSLVEELNREKSCSRVGESEIGQPASTAIQVALVDLLADLDIKPSAVVGHSSGEIVAAYAAGVLSHESVMKVSYHRSFLAKRCRSVTRHKGAMMAVGLGDEEANRYLTGLNSGKVVVACANSPTSTTVSGDEPAIDELFETLQQGAVFARKLVVDTAYHSHHMQAVAESYLASLSDIQETARSAGVKFFSSVTGREKTEGFGSAYWVENLVSKVRFHEAIASAYQDGARCAGTVSQIFLEVGPHHVLAGPMRDTLSTAAPKGQEPTCLPSLLRGTHAIVSLLESCGQLFEKGYEFNVNKLNYLDGAKERPNLVSDLAPYAWDHSTRYWLESRLSRAHRHRRYPRHELLGLRIPGTSPSEPAWRHFLDAANMPWLLEHVIDGYPIFPASGYITMAIEAKKQLSEERGIIDTVVNYVIKDLMLVKPLAIPDSPATAEIQISLHSTRRGKVTNWETFVVSSVTPDGAWSEHATGSIMTELKPLAAAKATNDAESAFSTETEVAQLSVLNGKELQRMSGEELYDYMSSKGNFYGPNFATVSSFSHDTANAVGHLTLPDTARNMPAGIEQPYIMHPGPLDALLHTSVPLFFENSKAESVMAVELEKVVIAANGLSTPGKTIDFVTTLTPTAPSSANMEVSAFTTNDKGEKDLVFRIFNGRLKGTASNDVALDGSLEHDQTYTVSWREDVDLFLPGKLDTQVPEIEAPVERFQLLNQASSLIIRSCLQDISESAIIPQYKAFYRWMQRYTASEECRDLISHLSADESAQVMKRLESMDEESQAVLRVGQKLGRIVQGNEKLAPNAEDNLHFDAHTYDGIARCYLYLLEFVKSVAFKKPKLRILEIGAGTGGFTKVLLDHLCKEWYASIDRYDYTDVSPNVFEQAREKFRKHSSFMQFQELDITRDPIEQGFSKGAYDLVIASNSIHVAPKIDDAIQSVRSLLKPGGRLLLVESTRVATFSNMIFGPSADWFCGVEDGRTDSPLLSVAEWNRRLARNKFCGVEFSRNDFDGYAQRFTFIVAQATEPAQIRKATPVQIIVSPRSSAPHLDSVKTLVKALATYGQLASVCTLPVESLDDNSIYLIADDRGAPILANTTEPEWTSISRILNHTSMRLMWVTLAHESVPSTKCEYGLALGLCRSARTENSSLKVVNVDVARDSVSKDSSLHQKLAHIVHKSFLVENAPEFNEYEVQIDNGRPLIPRLQPNETFNLVMKRAAGFEEPELTMFHQEDRPLKLSVRRPGLLDSMVFVDDERASIPLPACEVEVRVEAFGVNFKDVMLAIGQIDESVPMAGEFAGVVTAVGNDFEHRFNIGDRVCGLHATPYASHSRTHGDTIHHCPDSMTLNECASVPVVFVTAYHCLVDLAKLEPRQTILIHAAAGGVGQAAISIAKHIGAEIFVTAGTEPKADFLTEHFDIPKDHIFTSRSRLFKTGLMRMTQNRGVDVVLNSLSEDLLDESLDCVARFGSFLEIGKYDIHRKNAISLAPFDKAIQFFSVDLSAICQYRPHVTNHLLTNVMRHLGSGAYKLPGPLKTMPLSKIEEAFRLLQGGKLFGKIVLEAGDEEKIIATPKRNSVANFANSGTFVIAGGLGGLGLEVGRHLAARGAKHLALLSRRVLSVEKSKAVRGEFKALGAEIYLVQCDIADASSQNLLREQLKTAPPVESIIQSAMVTDDQSIEQMSLEQFSKTMPSKIDGSRNLLEAFASPYLKQMVMFSSCAGTFGGMRASNYAAANAAQDAFAVDQYQGTARVITIDLGPMKDVGVLSQQSNLVEKIAAQGFVAWGTDELFALLDPILDPKSLKEPPKQLLVGFTKESMVGAIHMHNIDNPILKHVLQNKAVDVGEGGAASDMQATTLGIKAAMENAADIQEATSVVRQQLAKKICSLSSAELEATTDDIPLSSFALDSLVLVELKNWIDRTFSASLQSTEISDAANLAVLSEVIASRSKLVKQHPQSDSEDSSRESKSESQDDSTSATATSISETELPKQPLPKLSESIEQYLAEVKLICNPTEFEATRTKALDLLHTSGPKYQEQLQKAADDPDVENWFSDLYLKHYFLQRRSSLLARSNFFGSQPFTKGYEAVDVAVALTLAAFAYKKRIETGRNQARHLVDSRIDMSAEHSIYNGFREPCLGEDRMVKHQSHNYIVVLRRGYAFKVMLQADENQSSAADLKATFKAILDVPLERRSNLAALTADGRDDWAKYRDHLSSISETNAASLQTIEAAAFVVCFDEAIPVGPAERALQFFCGDHHTNRWYDKTCQFVICPDGSAASLLEHTLLDGTSVASLREFILPRLQKELEDPAASALTQPFDLATSFTLLPFDTDASIEKRIEVVQSAIAEMQHTSSFESFALPNIGSDFWGAHRIPPKSGMQVLLQLAVHLYYGYNAPTAETVSLARYQRGRAAWTNTVSPQVKAFCDLVIRGGQGNGAHARALFRDAVAAHNASLGHAAANQTPRTNLTALKWVAQDAGDAAPALFADAAWRRYSDELVTVDCLESDFEECGLLQDTERVWVHFQTQPHRALFSVCARAGRKATEFQACVESAVETVRKMLGQK